MALGIDIGQGIINIDQGIIDLGQGIKEVVQGIVNRSTNQSCTWGMVHDKNSSH